MSRSARCIWVWFSLIFSAALWADSVRTAAETFFHQSFGDLQEELATARDEDKKGLLVMFETDDCPWCKRMKATVLNKKSIQDYYRSNFRILALDTNGDTLITDFSGNEVAEKDFALKHNRVRATPVFAFFNLKGNLVMRYTGATRNHEEFQWLGEFVVEDHYRTMKFTKYKRARRAALNKNKS